MSRALTEKYCPCCRVTKQAPDFPRRKDGRLYSYCKACTAIKSAEARGALPKSDPLNLALRDMPGSRVSLLGIAEAA